MNIFRGRFLLTLLVFGMSVSTVLSWPAEGQVTSCAPDAMTGIPAEKQNLVREFQKATESGAFYKEMVHRLGEPLSCTKDLDETDIKLSYTFRDHGLLEADTDPAIEFSEERIEQTGFTEQTAMELLKAQEKARFGKDGCGIDWNSPKKVRGENPGSQDVAYAGKACNCQGRIIYEKQSVVALILSSTC